MEIVWSTKASKDYTAIILYLKENWSLKIAQEYKSKVDSLIQTIVSTNGLCPQSKHINARRCVITKHNSLFYRINNDKLEIIRMFDTRQSLEKL